MFALFIRNPLEERENFGVGVMGSEIYLFGGCKMMGKCFDDFRVMNVTDACPNNCTGRGTCRNNRCNCNDGFSGKINAYIMGEIILAYFLLFVW